jgi:hypothetical protein
MFLFYSFPLLAQDIETKSGTDIEQKRAAIINNFVNMGEIIFGVAFAFQLAFVIIKVRKGLKESGEIVNWGIYIIIYIIVFEVLIKTILYNFIGFSG